MFHTEGVVERLLRTQCMLLIDQGDLGRWGENGICPIKTVVADSVFFWKKKFSLKNVITFFAKITFTLNIILIQDQEKFLDINWTNFQGKSSWVKWVPKSPNLKIYACFPFQMTFKPWKLLLKKVQNCKKIGSKYWHQGDYDF